LRSACFEDFVPKQPDRTWVWTSVTLALKAVESCSKAQKTHSKTSYYYTHQCNKLLL